MLNINIFFVCLDVYQLYEGDDFDKIDEVLSKLKNRKLKIINILIEKYKDMNPDFEQDLHSRTAGGIYKIGQDSFKLMKKLA